MELFYFTFDQLLFFKPLTAFQGFEKIKILSLYHKYEYLDEWMDVYIFY